MYIALPWLKSKHFDKYFVHVIYAESLCVDLERQTKEKQMGRPLHKKLFGNRNIGTTGTSDNNIGGEGIASINWSQLGSFRGNDGAHNPLVGFALPAPTLPGGVQAAWAPLFEVASVTTGAGSVGLVVGDTYTFAGLGSPVFTVATSSNNGTNATFTVTSRGEFDLTAMPGDTTGATITKVSGSGANTFMVDINFRVKSAVITEKGSGYTGTETFTVTLYAGSAGTAPAGTIVKTVDSGATNNNDNAGTNQENAILVSAQTTTGGTDKAGDIISQKGARRFKVKTADGTAVCELTASANLTAGQMSIIATDARGNTYYVTKLTAKKATLTRKTQNGANAWVVVEGGVAQWGFSAASGAIVQVANA